MSSSGLRHSSHKAAFGGSNPLTGTIYRLFSKNRNTWLMKGGVVLIKKDNRTCVLLLDSTLNIRDEGIRLIS